MRKNVSVALALVMALSLILCGVAAEAKDAEIAVVVKISGIPWFNRLEEGVKRAAGELKVNAYQQGPSDADPAQQVKIVEDLIAKGVSAICDNKKFGEMNFERVAKAMGGKGEFAVFVGSLTVPLHNYWADVGLAYVKAKYPEMKLVTDRIPCGESVEESFKKTNDLLKTYPNLKGIVGFGSLGPIGAAQALKKKGPAGAVAVVGTVIPSHAAPSLKDGYITHGYLWDPADAGYAMVAVAKAMLDKQEIKEGQEIKGLGAMKIVTDPDTKGKVITFDKILDITAESAGKLGF